MLVCVDGHGLQHAAFNYLRKQLDSSGLLFQRHLQRRGQLLLRDNRHRLQHAALDYLRKRLHTSGLLFQRHL